MFITKKIVASKYRQGGGWIVSIYVPLYDSWELSVEMDYWHACAAVKEARQSWNTRLQKYED